MDKLDIDIKTFFESIRACTITEIEIRNTVEKLTDALNYEKLKLLIDDFDFYLFVAKEEKIAEYNSEDISKAIEELKSKGKDIPYKKIKNTLNGKNGEIIKIDVPNEVIDIEALLFPFEFFCCYKFKKNLSTFLEKILEKEFDRLNNKYELKYGIGIPYGAYLFDEIGANLPKAERHKKLKEELYKYKKAYLTDPELINDPEIKRIIDLIENELEYLEIDSTQSNNIDTQIRKTKNAHDLSWFKIGLKFATGEAQKSYEKHKDEKGQFAIITKELGFNPILRPYFSETINNTNQNDKNIYSNQKKLKAILIHCQSNQISVCPEFLARIQPE